MYSKKSRVLAMVVMAIGLVASSIGTGTAVGATASAAPSSDAVLVKAEGNTTGATAATGTASGAPTVELAALYPWGYRNTKAECEAAGQALIQQYPGRFHGYSCVRGTGKNATKWQLYMDEKVCVDRVAHTPGIGATRVEI